MSGNILVTGGAGFIGYHLSRKLVEKGYRVIIADNFARGSLDSELSELVENPSVTMVNVDLRDGRSLDSIASDLDYVVHLAAIIGVQNVIERPL